VSGQRKALIVANDEYEHEGLRRLLAPAADALALGRVLGDREIGDFAVQVVRNEPAHIIQAHIEEMFSESRSDDVLLLHFSGHGLKNESGELFFAAPNTRPNRLGSTAVSADFVQRCMRAARSRSIVLLLDCCYGGAFARGVTVRASGDINVLSSFPQERPGGGRGRAVITASSAMEYAFEGDQLAGDEEPRPSVFTTALVEGLTTGDADRDQDGWVSLNELYDYVFDKVREQNPHQTPSRDVEMQGELFIARRSRPVTTPARLPPELEQAVDHPLAGIRAGAVQELTRILRGGHAGLALGARLALERLADDDSRTVSAAAIAALRSGTATAGGPAPEGAAAAVPEPARPAPPRPGSEPRAEEPRTGQQPEPEALPAQEPAAADAGPIAGRSAVGPAASAPPPATPPATPPAAALDPWLLTAAVLQILGAVLIAVSLYLVFFSDFRLYTLAANTWQIYLDAAIAVCAGVCILVPATRRVIGPGLLLGAVATAPGDLAFTIIAVHVAQGSPGAGYWLINAADMTFLLAACLAVVSLRRSRDLRFSWRSSASVLPWLVRLVGVAGAAAFLLQVKDEAFIPGFNGGPQSGELTVPLIWITAMALLVPAVAAAVLPRSFGVALLAGWIVVALGEISFFTGFSTSAFGYSLAVLALAAIPFARDRSGAADVKPAPGGDATV
jgi:hypothetical protein